MAGRRVLARPLWVWLHRWAGLAMAAFLVCVGLTGSLLAYDHELERVFAPQLFAQRRDAAPPLDLATLAERAQALVPRARVEAVSFTEPDQVSVSFSARPDPVTHRPPDLGFTDFFIDPWTGRELGRRTWGDLSEGRINLMPFLYELHWRLVAGDVGQWTLGVVAIVWTLDCCNGFYLTLPRFLPGFWRRWKTAWTVKRGASFLRLNFDLHRAGGLWLWVALFVFGWSSVMMNIRPVYETVMQGLFDYRSPDLTYAPAPKANTHPRLTWRDAQAVGERLIREQGARQQFKAGDPLGLQYLESMGAYIYEVRGSRDVFERAPKGGGTAVIFDGDTGALRELSLPTGQHAGNTVESWLYALHMARVWGRPYQVFVCLLGLATAVLSVTGAYIWIGKRRARRRTPIHA